MLNVAAHSPGSGLKGERAHQLTARAPLQTLRTAARSLASPSIVSRSLIKKHSRYGEPPPRFLVPVLFFIFPRLLSSSGSQNLTRSPLLSLGLLGPSRRAGTSGVGVWDAGQFRRGVAGESSQKTGRETYRVVIGPAPTPTHRFNS